MNIERIEEMLREAGKAIVARSSELPIDAPWIIIEVMPRGFHVRGSTGRGDAKRSHQSTVPYSELLTNQGAENPLIRAIERVDAMLTPMRPPRAPLETRCPICLGPNVGCEICNPTR